MFKRLMVFIFFAFLGAFALNAQAALTSIGDSTSTSSSSSSFFSKDSDNNLQSLGSLKIIGRESTTSNCTYTSANCSSPKLLKNAIGGTSNCFSSCECPDSYVTIDTTRSTGNGTSCDGKYQSFSCKTGFTSVANGCANCTDGYYANNNTCTICPKGSWCADETKTLCLAGTYNPYEGQSSSTACIACDEGTTSAAGASSCSACTNSSNVKDWSSLCNIASCNSGNYYLSGNACNTCQNNSTSSGGTSTSCTCDTSDYPLTSEPSNATYTTCTATDNSKRYKITSCNGGYKYSSTACTQCSAGTYSAGGTTTTCSNCANGYCSKAGSSNCVLGDLTCSSSTYPYTSSQGTCGSKSSYIATRAKTGYTCTNSSTFGYCYSSATTCSSDETCTDGVCVATSTCDTNQIANSSGVCYCPFYNNGNYYYYKNSNCIACPTGTEGVTDEGDGCECFSSDYQGIPVSWDSSTNTCVCGGQGYSYSADENECVCGEGYYINNSNVCTACPNGGYSAGDNTTECECDLGEGEVWDSATGKCVVECTAGFCCDGDGNISGVEYTYSSTIYCLMPSDKAGSSISSFAITKTAYNMIGTETFSLLKELDSDFEGKFFWTSTPSGKYYYDYEGNPEPYYYVVGLGGDGEDFTESGTYYYNLTMIKKE